MQMGESIAVGGLSDEKCPFKEDSTGISAFESEAIANDDRNAVQGVQANNGGTLGENLTNASNGTENTWKGAPFEPQTAEKAPANDSKRKNGVPSIDWARVRVPATTTIAEGDYPYTVAAHHLIPGNASLYNDDDKLKDYMIKGKTVKAAGKTWKIKHHIGYNVNGAHNGVWLPGNYAIRAGSSPTRITWGSMTNEDWQLNYVAACSKVAKGQFHDAHTNYNDSVLSLLNKIATKLEAHQCGCDECKSKSEVPPPYAIKQRLYKLSTYFRFNLISSPNRWRRPWFSSDRWEGIVFNGSTVPSAKFLEALKKSRRVEKN
jgi:A nuclease family of the HNH/ENDO VII superfamily with conserved AHH